MMYDLADLRHLPGQHDQKTHGRGGGGGTPDAPKGERVTDPNRMVDAIAADLNVGAEYVSDFSDDVRADAKRAVASRLAAGMSSSTEALVAEAQARAYSVDMDDALTSEPGSTHAVDARVVAVIGNGELDLQDIGNGWDVEYELARKGWKRQGADATIADMREHGLIADDGTLLFADGYVMAGSPRARDMVREAAVSSLVEQWAMTSNDGSVRSHAIQRAAEEEFGLAGAAKWRQDVSDLAFDADVAERYSAHGAVYRDFLRTQYDQTQAWFAERGIASVQVYRGLRSETHAPVGDDVEVQTRPLSSWAYSPYAAGSFAGTEGVVIRTEVPVSRVLSQSTTGIGCLNEAELVVLGPAVRGSSYRYDRTMGDDTPAWQYVDGKLVTPSEADELLAGYS